MTDQWIDNCIHQWQHESIELNAPVSLDVIDKIESSIGFIFPADFRQFYSKVNGFVDFGWRPNMFSLWSVERILLEYTEATEKEFIGFSDYLIQSHRIGFLKTKDGIFKDYDLNNPIASSFEEAIQLINIDCTKIY